MRKHATANPFKAKGELDPDAFCGREETLESAIRSLKAGRSVALTASRRSGKSWLAQAALRRLERGGVLTAYLDLVYVHSPLRWIELFASGVLSAVSASPQDLFHWTRRHAPGLGIDSVSAEPSGYRLRLRGHFGESEFQEVAEEVYRLPEAIARETKKRIVICLDEYPEVISFVGPKILAAWKRQLRESKAVSYLLASARPKLIYDIFEAPGAPMAGLVQILHLGPIPRKTWEEFILHRFRRGGFSISREAVSRIVEATHGYSYYAQMACRHLWNRRSGERGVRLDDVEELTEWLLDQEDSYFEQIWRGLTKPRQSFLAAVAKDPGRAVFAADFRVAHRLPAASTLQAALKCLEEEGLLERDKSGCRVVDPFFREWLARRVG